MTEPRYYPAVFNIDRVAQDLVERIGTEQVSFEDGMAELTAMVEHLWRVVEEGLALPATDTNWFARNARSSRIRMALIPRQNRPQVFVPPS